MIVVIAVIAMVLARTVRREGKTIGTLMALGYRKSELIRALHGIWHDSGQWREIFWECCFVFLFQGCSVDSFSEMRNISRMR